MNPPRRDKDGNRIDRCPAFERLSKFTYAINYHPRRNRQRPVKTKLITELLFLRAYPHWFENEVRASETARVRAALGLR